MRRDRTERLATIADRRRKGVRVCTTTGSTSERELSRQRITAEPVDTNGLCLTGLQDGTYDAFSTDLPILAGMAQAHEVATGKEAFELLDLVIAEKPEKIGVAVPNDDWAMRDVIAWYLHRCQTGEEKSRWQHAYERAIGPFPTPSTVPSRSWTTRRTWPTTTPRPPVEGARRAPRPTRAP